MNEQVAQRLAEVVGELPGLSSQVAEDGDRIDVIAMLEKLKAAASAAQLSVVADFAASREAANRALGVEARAARRGVPVQVGLARKVAPATAARQVSQARALRDELPETFALLAAGEVSEWVATIVVTETSHLAAEDRRLVDKQLATELPDLSPRRAQARAKALAYEVDPEGAVRRAGNARKDRRVSMRPAPDTMAMLSALLPCEQGVAAWAALRRHADQVIGAGGDERTRDQVMADTLVERLTGQATADSVDAEIGLVMSDSTLFGGDDEPADLGGYGPIPAETARDIARRATANGDNDGDESGTPADTGAYCTDGIADTADTGGTGATGDHGVGKLGGDVPTSRRSAEVARLWLRRLVIDPVTGIVIDCDPRRRRFTGVLARMLVYRDQYCRTPYCDAPIRHLDHIVPHADGGPTTAGNGQGLCERCNYVRQMPGWTSTAIDSDRHLVETTTPTGHRYRSRAPAAPGTRRRRQPVPT